MARLIVLLVSLLIWAPVSVASPTLELKVPLQDVGALKRTYLACEDAALAGLLDGAGIAECSAVYEDLKRRGFDGSFQRLRTWYEGVRALGVTGAASAEMTD